MAKGSKDCFKKPLKRKIFFNYATVGLIGKPAYKAALAFLNDYMQIGPPEVLDKYDNYSAKLSIEASKLLNCEPQEITYVKNTTEGIVIASETLPLQAGDQVLLTASEYPANLLPWLKKKKDGIDVKIITGQDNHKAFLKLLDSINPKTKAVSISWGQYYDGYIPDLALLSKVCRQNNAFLVVDGVHGVGTRKIDLRQIDVDFLACGGQKTLGAVVGIGFLYINKKVLDRLLDFKVGIRSVYRFDASGYSLKLGAERFTDGTANILGIVSLYASIKDVNRQGIENIQKKNLALLAKYKQILRQNNIDFIDYKDQANILSLKVFNPAGLAKFLRHRNIYIKPVGDVARISFSHNSNERDFIKTASYIKQWILAAEKQAARQARRRKNQPGILAPSFVIK